MSYKRPILEQLREHYSNGFNAAASRSTVLSRLRNAIVSLHAFEPVEFFTQSPQFRNSLLVLTGALTVLGTSIGYILALPAGRKHKQDSD